MVKSIKNRICLIIFLLILLLGFFLRIHNLYTWPRLGATFDEYAWTWQGISLIQNHIPTSWSPHPQYKKTKNIIYQKTPFRLVTPYLEHPPFFGLIAGTFALMSGAKDIYHIDLRHIRGLALILGVISIGLVMLLTHELYQDKGIALIAGLLYAVVPSIAVGSRILQNENFFIPIWLLSLYLISKYLKTKKTRYRNIAAILCGLLSISKVPWLAGAFSIVLIFLFLKRYRDILFFLSVVLPIFLIYFVYGFYFDRNLFLSLWSLQLNRYDLAFNSIYALFQKPYLIDRFYTDGWIYFGWFAIFLLLIKDIKKNIFIIFPFLSYFLIFLAGIPDEAGHGWYRFPFYPYLIISIALFLKEYFNKNYFLTFLFLVFVGTSLLQNVWMPAFGFSYFIFRVAIISWVLPLFLQISNIKKGNIFSNIINKSWFFVYIILSILAVMQYNEQ